MSPQIQIRHDTGICHFRVPRDQQLTDFLSKVDLSELKIQAGETEIAEWLYLGAIYVNGERCRQDVKVEADQIIRLHARPKHYLSAEPPDGGWQSRIVAENEGFLVFDKPSGMPTHPTLDNFIENAKFILESEKGIPLYTTHRLDIPTQGLLILAKNSRTQVALNKEFARGRVTKIYHAISDKRVECGEYTHYIDPTSRVPRTISEKFHQSWWECRLEVQDTGCQKDSPGYWHRVRLLTGKTHQIRAQFAAMGAPLIGDTTYGSYVQSGELGLECFALSFSIQGQSYLFERKHSLVKI